MRLGGLEILRAVHPLNPPGGRLLQFRGGEGTLTREGLQPSHGPCAASILWTRSRGRPPTPALSALNSQQLADYFGTLTKHLLSSLLFLEVRVSEGDLLPLVLEVISATGDTWLHPGRQMLFPLATRDSRNVLKTIVRNSQNSLEGWTTRV